MAGVTRTILTTGANSGLGLATTIELARRGHRSVGTVRSDAKAEHLHTAAADAGVTVEHRLLDVTDADACAEVIDDVAPDAVVNNAGFGRTTPVELVGDDEARLMLETMLVAPVRLARLALPHMRARGGGHVVMISSILGRVTVPLSGWYQAAKHGLEAVTDAFRQEVAGDDVRVVLVEPGFFRTGIFDEMAADAERHAGSAYDEAFARARANLDRARWAMGDPGAVARRVAKVIDDDTPRARYLVGPDAVAMELMSPWVPTAIRDRLSRFALGL